MRTGLILLLLILGCAAVKYTFKATGNFVCKLEFYIPTTTTPPIEPLIPANNKSVVDEALERVSHSKSKRIRREIASDFGFNFTNVHVELWEHDIISSDDYISTNSTNEDGYFEVEGTEDESFNVQFFLKIFHDCTKDGKQVCYRKNYYSQDFDGENAMTKNLTDFDLTDKFGGC